MLNDIIDAVRLEIERLGEPCNRTRYFLFGKADELETDEVLGFTFRNAPDRVLRDARWTASRQEECLFKIGDAFANGFMALSENGVTVDFTLEELAQRGLSVSRVQHAADRGIEYVMDTRDLTGHLMGFLDARRDEPNPVLEDILSGAPPAAVDPIAKTGRLSGLNPSQTHAIEKALSQRVTFLWGPPGTGKTRTMAALAALLVKKRKRVLLSALSNLALDQLLLATAARLGPAARDVAIARTGTQMSEACAAYGRRSFERRGSGSPRGSSPRASSLWDDHVAGSHLVASNFTMLTLPRGASHGAFDYVLADEVSMSNIPNLAAASFYAGTGMVLGGDPFQLPPIYPGDAEIPNEFFRRNVFETAGIVDRHDPRVAFLDTQYRMQKEIGDLVSDLFYGGELKTAAPPVPHIGDFEGRVIFAQSAGRVQVADEGATEVEEQRRFNRAHAETVSDYVVSLLEAGLAGNEIGVITPYNAQLVMIMEKLQETVGDYGAPAGGIKVSTIHSFQGQERRAIIVDFTDDNVRPSPLTARWELVNVALSRAKELLVIVGNRHYLQSEEFFSRKEAAVFEKMISHAVVMG
jgi:superfamily I DNA and/or RNA helicase